MSPGRQKTGVGGEVGKVRPRHWSGGAFSGIAMAIYGSEASLGDDQPMLRRLGDPIPELMMDLWLLVHEDLRRTARIRRS